MPLLTPPTLWDGVFLTWHHHDHVMVSRDGDIITITWHNSLSFPTNSSDSFVLSIPYVRSSLGKRAFSVIGPRLWNSLPPDTRNSSSLPIFRSMLNTHFFQNCIPSLGSFPVPLIVYLNFNSWYSYILCPIDWHLVRRPAMPTSLKSITFLLGLENYKINPWTMVLDLIRAWFVGGLTPSGASQPLFPSFHWPHWFSLKKVKSAPDPPQVFTTNRVLDLIRGMDVNANWHFLIKSIANTLHRLCFISMKVGINDHRHQWSWPWPWTQTDGYNAYISIMLY